MSVTDAGENYEGGDQVPQGESPDLVQARNHAKKLEDQLKAKDKKLAELEAKDQVRSARERQAQLEQSLGEHQIPPGYAKAYQAMYPDGEITTESIQAFAADLGIAAGPEPTNEKSQAQAQPTTGGPGLPQPAGAAPAVTWHNPSVSGSTVISPNSLTPREFDRLARENPAAARQAQMEGRVNWSHKPEGKGDPSDVVEHSPGVWGMRTKGT